MSCPPCHEGSSQRSTRALHKLEHRKFQLDITKQVLHHQLGQTPGNRPQKTEGTPSLGVDSSSTRHGAEQPDLSCSCFESSRSFWPKPLCVRPMDLNLFLISQGRFWWALKALPAWPGSSPGQAPRPWVCIRNSSAQAGPPGPASVLIIMIKWKERTQSINSHSCDFFYSTL